MTFFDIEYLKNDMRWSRSYYRTSAGSRMCSIAYWHVQWPLRTPNSVFQVTAFLKLYISIMVCLKHKVTIEQNTNRKVYPLYRMVQLSVTSSDLWLGFQGSNIFRHWISQKWHEIEP